VDIGGTFTDVVAVRPPGPGEAAPRVRTLKVPSTPDDPARAVLEGVRRVAEADGRDGGPPDVVHGSTVATNAVLERDGARTAFLATRGFGDLLTLARQDRPELYDLFADRPEPLVPAELCREVDERVDAGGEVVEPLDEDEVAEVAAGLRDRGVESVAVCFLFSFLRPDHERRAAEVLREAGLRVSASADVLPEFREYERASTTAMDAYVTPVLDRYLGRLDDELPARGLRVMQSDGGSGGVPYPEDVEPETLDLAGLDVYETADSYQFVWEFAAAAGDGGLGQRHLRLYLRDPARGGDGATPLREGLNGSVEAPYQYRAVVTPEAAVLEDANGERVADLDVSVAEQQVRVDVPAEALAAEPRETELLALVAAHDSDVPDGVTALDTAGANVLNVVTPPLTTQGEALRDSAEGVVAPYVSLVDGVRNLRLDAELLAEWDDPAGDDHGPGSYTYPDSKRWPEGTLDLTRFTVFEGEARYHCQFQFREPVDGERAGGRSQHLQLYLRDPEADGGTTAAREGVNAEFAAPYHHRVVADGSTAVVEDASGAVVSDAVTVETRDELRGVWVTVPRDAVGDLSTAALVPLVMGSSITGPGGVAQIEPKRSITDFGGRERATQPNVVDLLTPAGVTQAEALPHTGGLAAIPFVRFESGR
jgi:hypothetical protein